MTVLGRALFRPDGRVRARRMTATVGVCVGLALFGSFLLAATPSFESSLAQTGWVLFAVVLLKVPLISLLFWLILRNLEWPTRRPRWSDEEVAEILGYLRTEALRAEAMPDTERRLAYLLGETWHVADRAEGSKKGEAVAVALEIDARLQARRARRT